MLRTKEKSKWSKPVVIRFHKDFDTDLRKYCVDNEKRVATFLRDVIEKRLGNKVSKYRVKQ